MEMIGFVLTFLIGVVMIIWCIGMLYTKYMFTGVSNSHEYLFILAFGYAGYLLIEYAWLNKPFFITFN